MRGFLRDGGAVQDGPGDAEGRAKDLGNESVSILHVNQIAGALHRMFDGEIDLADVTPNPDEREKCFLTRSLAAFAVAQLAGITAPEAAKTVTDGTGDNGIDALHYDLATKTMYVVQAKWHGDGNGSFDRADILKFTKGFEDLTNRHQPKLHQIQREGPRQGTDGEDRIR